MQDPAIAVVVDLHRRVDAANRLEALLTIIAFGDNLQLLPRLQVVVETLDIVDFLAG